MTSHLKREESARRVADALDRAGERGMTLSELTDTTGMTVSQTRAGLAYLKEAIPGLKGSSAIFSYDPHGHLYRTAFIADVVEAYELMRIAGECTRSYRILSGTVIPHTKNSRGRAVRMLRRHLELVVDESHDLLEPT
ncbi:hypothetical protein IGX29_00715 [Streptomyces sp. H28]|uniref:hypothetical protein n=1 Tax=unclassified Streptomyces TaxID=2593676 RepID=UPI00178463B9|nr:hypothetical protein [Streptomyces sp. H28]MBD9730358.1 hypothetical protein [Streptomyces sp. H28]MBM7087192.1 hypothetical protein [Streptomyces sp. S12]